MENEKGGTTRLASLDAVRGFDMFFIMGGEGLIVALAGLMGHPHFHKVMGHVPWDGLHFMDTIFPTFLFLAGVSFPFSVAKSLAQGATKIQIFRKAFIRFLMLVLLGVLGGLLSFDFEHMRVWSVLGRIGIAWFGAAVLYLLFGLKTRIGIAVALLAGVTLFTRFVLAPDAPAGASPFTPAGNFGCWLDRLLTTGHMFRGVAIAEYRGLYDPEGFAGILPAIVTAMLGMFMGEVVRRPNAKSLRTCGLLAALATGFLVAGLALSLVCPINKALWSPSFVLVVGGYSTFLFLAFYLVIDVLGWTKWAFPFVVIGMNAITIYMAQRIIGFHQTTKFFFGGVQRLLPESCGDWNQVIMSAGYTLVCWLFLYFLYRKKVFLKV